MSLPATTKVLCIATLLMASLGTAFAAEAPPSDTSIRELMTVTRVREQMKDASAQADAMMQASMEQALQGQQLTAEQRKALDEMRAQLRKIVEEALEWKELEALVTDIYKRSFNQREIDGMLAFYKTEAGKAVISKMPLITQNTMQAMQGRLAVMMPKIQQAQEEMLAKLKASK
jgi:uncharacterized protein